MSADLAEASVERWSADQVAALAPDPSSLKAARGLGAAKWQDPGVAGTSLWGLCKGSATYQVCVDLAEPAYRCSCPSRKFPCKHALGLLLLWSAGSVGTGEPPAWMAEWRASRAERAAKAEKRAEKSEADPAAIRAAARRAEKRDERVSAGVADLDRWVTDQIRDGLAGLSHAGYQHFDTVAARMVDAAAPGLATAVRRLAGLAVAGNADALLAELSLLHLLTRAYARIDELPEPLAATVRGRIGTPTPAEQILATEPARDVWQVVGSRDEVDERLTTRRVWLRGRASGQAALVLSFAVAGQPLAADLVVGTEVEADICFYPGAVRLRALVAKRHGAAASCSAPAGAVGIDAAVAEFAAAIAAEPWLDAWPVLLHEAVLAPPTTPQAVWTVATGGHAMPLHPGAPSPWRLAAATGGRPSTIAAELTPAGLRPLAGWTETGVVRP
ncbi:hypothetical protein F4553_004344 [Allocatelliglobosispora scoriae]|uniref:SWIM-type domain-containing protein n=1 Tax=Allocatelliglobosispora scoriae TaxID=643052 RepID=A0A841BTD6_9ACTN|nr:SWIM zinc finger family protein [Allocatelliglobosispora scoriae]MBB5870965.1 hypothetical protein [Allocatelliglobosispora scoriae]